MKYMSVSQYHSFFGSPTYPGCEAMTMATLNGKWERKVSDAMLVGSYVDEYFSGDLMQFKLDHPDIFTLKGDLKASFKKAEEIIKVAEADTLFLKYIKGEGEQQLIVTGEIGGVLWKGKLDNLYRGKAIIDLKVVASIRDKIWNPQTKEKETFIEAYGYIDQAAVYQELYFQMSGERLPVFIAAITKEDYPDKEIIQIPELMMQQALEQIKSKAGYYKSIKDGIYPPVHCGICDYCRSVKKLESTIMLTDLY